MKTVVIGLGVFGYAAAIALAKNGVEVIAIDHDMSLVESIKDDVSLAVCLDASNLAALKAHDIAGADVLIAAVGLNFEVQVLTVVHAKKLGVKRIVARALTATHAEILSEVGAHEVLHPEDDSARRLAQRLLLPNIADYFEVAEGFSVVEVTAPAGVVGHSLKELSLRPRFRINVVAIKHAEPAVGSSAGSFRFDPAPHPEEAIKEGDRLILVGSNLDIGYALDVLRV